MGLDMYAYRLKADLAPVEDIDVNITAVIAAHKGFELKTNDYFRELGEDVRDAELSQYRENLHAVMSAAHEEGLFEGGFAQWRKFNHLHGFMEELYRKKGGTQSFNCTTVRLKTEDLELLEQSASGLAPVSGLFFGSDLPMEAEDVSAVLSFVKRARAAIADGYAIYYDSWW